MYSKFLIIIPTYNERANIEIILRKFSTARNSLLPGLEVLVVDDSSPDGTSQAVKELCLPWVHILDREFKNGLGSAYKAGFAWAIENSYQFVIEMDADGSHRIDDLMRLLSVSQDVDLVLGSRWIEMGQIQNWPWYRRILSRAGNTYARVLLRIKINDMTSGYRRIKVSALKKVDYEQLCAKGYGFQVEMVALFDSFNLTVVEVPITFIERTLGKSKMTIGIAFEAWITVTRLALKNSF